MRKKLENFDVAHLDPQASKQASKQMVGGKQHIYNW
jgi:hypothetical protein